MKYSGRQTMGYPYFRFKKKWKFDPFVSEALLTLKKLNSL
jgi:hypothetical protein